MSEIWQYWNKNELNMHTDNAKQNCRHIKHFLIQTGQKWSIAPSENSKLFLTNWQMMSTLHESIPSIANNEEGIASY